MRLNRNQAFKLGGTFFVLGLRGDVRVVEKAGYLEKLREVLENLARARRAAAVQKQFRRVFKRANQAVKLALIIHILLHNSPISPQIYRAA